MSQHYPKYQVFDGFLYELTSVDAFYGDDGKLWFISPEYVRCFPKES